MEYGVWGYGGMEYGVWSVEYGCGVWGLGFEYGIWFFCPSLKSIVISCMIKSIYIGFLTLLKMERVFDPCVIKFLVILSTKHFQVETSPLNMLCVLFA